MTNLEKLNNIFYEVFNVEASALGVEFNNNNIDGWDSVHQLTLAAALEDYFDILLDPEDIIACVSYAGIKEILRKFEIEL